MPVKFLQKATSFLIVLLHSPKARPPTTQATIAPINASDPLAEIPPGALSSRLEPVSSLARKLVVVAAVAVTAAVVVVSLDPVEIGTESVELFSEVAEYGGVSLAVI